MKFLFSFTTTATILSLSLFPTLLTQAKVVQKLPAFPINALEPVVSAKSLALHLQLHARYVQRTNELIAGTILDKLPLQPIVLTAPYRSELYNNSLQAYNHNFQWQVRKKEKGQKRKREMLGARLSHIHTHTPTLTHTHTL
jgi:superoxide dismutase